MSTVKPASMADHSVTMRTRTSSRRTEKGELLVLQKGIEEVLKRFDGVKRRKQLVDERLFMCLKERRLLEKEMTDAVFYSLNEGHVNHIKLKHMIKNTTVWTEKTNFTRYDLKLLRSVATSRKTDYKYLTSYLGWKQNESKKAEKIAKKYEKKLAEVDAVNDKELDELMAAKETLDNCRQEYKNIFEKFVEENDSDATAMSSQKRKLEDIIGQGHYIDSYSLMKEMLRKYIVNNREKLATSKIYCNTFLAMGNSLEKLMSHHGSEDMIEFINWFIESESYFHSLERRLALIENNCGDTQEDIYRDKAELEQYKSLQDDLLEKEKEIIMADEDSAIDTCLMILEHKLEKERDFNEYINSRFEDFYECFEIYDETLAAEMLHVKQNYLFREAQDHRKIIEGLVDKTLFLKEKIAGRSQLTLPEGLLMKSKSRKTIDLQATDRTSKNRKMSVTSRQDSQGESQGDDADTSVDSLRESERVRLSQFIDKKSNFQLWKHEASFRKKTNHIIGTAFEKKKMEKEKVEELLPVIGGYMAKTVTTLEMIARKSKLSFPDLQAKAAKETSQTTDRSLTKNVTLKDL